MLQVKVFETPEILAKEFANYFIELITSKPFYNTCLSGGSTPKLFFNNLANTAQNINWKFLSFYWGDERCVPPTHNDSNYLMTKSTLFDHVIIPKENIHRIKGENTPILEAIRYSTELLTCLPSHKNTPQFDLIILGMGDDGHTASIFPYNKELFNSPNIMDVSLHPTSGQKRITITGKIIKHAYKVVFLVTGKNKAQKIQEIFEKKGDYESYPAWLVQQAKPEVEWWLDSEAASLLKL